MIEHETSITSMAAAPEPNAEWLNLTLHVNGREHEVRARTHHTLLDVLRDRVGLIDTREGCGVGMCGACTVVVDGRIVSGCLMLAAQAEGREIVTVEGLVSDSGELHPIQDAFVEHTGFQCSYCTPGFVLAAKTLLDEDPETDREHASAYLAGNLCRCGSYVKILDAVIDARDRLVHNVADPIGDDVDSHDGRGASRANLDEASVSDAMPAPRTG